MPEYFTSDGKLKNQNQINDTKVQEVFSDTKMYNAILSLTNTIGDIFNKAWRRTGGNMLYNLETITSIMDAPGSTFFKDNLYRRLAVGEVL